jgi:hypothetical protein
MGGSSPRDAAEHPEGKPTSTSHAAAVCFLVFAQGGYLSWLEVCSWSDDIEGTLASACH